jgi:hypothetical protein
VAVHPSFAEDSLDEDLLLIVLHLLGNVLTNFLSVIDAIMKSWGRSYSS